MKLTIGRIVLYVLSWSDAEEINEERVRGVGNIVSEGDIYPAIAVRVFNDAPANFQVFLDGSDTYWATSRLEDAKKKPGSWHWPERN